MSLRTGREQPGIKQTRRCQWWRNRTSEQAIYTLLSSGSRRTLVNNNSGYVITVSYSRRHLRHTAAGMHASQIYSLCTGYSCGALLFCYCSKHRSTMHSGHRSKVNYAIKSRPQETSATKTCHLQIYI